jgi:hypothetical protein
MIKDYQEQHNLQDTDNDNYDSVPPSQEEEDSPSFRASRRSDRRTDESIEAPQDYERDSGSTESIEGATEGSNDDASQEEDIERTNATTDEQGEGQQQDQSATPSTMTKEEILLLQVLRRAKRQQELITEVQRSLRTLTNIDKSIEKTTAQVKQLQSTMKDTQKQIVQIQRQIATVERAQEKGFQKMTSRQKAGPSSTKAKVSARKNKKNKSKKRQ